jgi:hypothetical protein
MSDSFEKPAMKEPPKINLGLLQTPPPEPAPMPPPLISLEPKPVEASEAIMKAKLTKAKSETSRIDLTAAEPLPEQVPTVSDVLKSRAIPVGDIKEESLEDLYKAALNATQRVVLEERKSETTKIAAAEVAKKSTAQIDVQSMMDAEPKSGPSMKETMHIDMEGKVKSKPEGTIKIERSASSAPPSSTMQITLPSEYTDAEKSKTARIELPREITSTTPPSQRKTIRIKRPDGAPGGAPAARPALSVARKPGGAVSTKSTVEDVDLPAAAGDAPSSVTAWAALIAVLLSVAVVYLLVATISSGLPFPGRLI